MGVREDTELWVESITASESNLTSFVVDNNYIELKQRILDTLGVTEQEVVADVPNTYEDSGIADYLNSLEGEEI